MTPPSEFTYNGRQVEIVPPDTAHRIGNYWQIKIDGVLLGNFLFSSARMAADEAKKFIDRHEEYSLGELLVALQSEETGHRAQISNKRPDYQLDPWCLDLRRKDRHLFVIGCCATKTAGDFN